MGLNWKLVFFADSVATATAIVPDRALGSLLGEQILDAHGKLADADASGVVDRGSNGGRDSGEAYLPYAANAERVKHLVGIVEESDVDLRSIGIGGHDVVGEVVVNRNAETWVVHCLLEEGHAYSHD